MDEFPDDGEDIVDLVVEAARQPAGVSMPISPPRIAD